MNKGLRHIQKMLKLKKRLKNYRLTNTEGNFYAFRSHGKPCSCWMCVDQKYERHKLKRRSAEEIKASRCSAYEYLIP